MVATTKFKRKREEEETLGKIMEKRIKKALSVASVKVQAHPVPSGVARKEIERVS